MSLTSHQRQHRGQTDVWLTPRHIIDALGLFDLDPCAAPDPRPWPTARQHIALPQNGLDADWRGLVWCNPPFGPDVGKWLGKLADHGNGIGLCAARTETRWFRAQVWDRADAILYLHGRPRFCLPDGSPGPENSGAPICLAAYGPTAMDRLADSGLTGALVTGWRATGRVAA